MVIEVSELQPENAESPIEETLLPIVTDSKLWQSENVKFPIEVTELGMVIEVNEEDWNALLAITLVLELIWQEVIDVSLVLIKAWYWFSELPR